VCGECGLLLPSASSSERTQSLLIFQATFVEWTSRAIYRSLQHWVLQSIEIPRGVAQVEKLLKKKKKELKAFEEAMKKSEKEYEVDKKAKKKAQQKELLQLDMQIGNEVTVTSENFSDFLIHFDLDLFIWVSQIQASIQASLFGAGIRLLKISLGRSEV